MSFMDVDRDADTQATVLVGDPDLVLDGAATSPSTPAPRSRVTVDVGERRPRGRRSPHGRTASTASAGSASRPSGSTSSTRSRWTRPNAEHFDFTTPLAPAGADARAEGGQGAARPHRAGRLDAARRRRSRRRAVDVGTGSAEEFAAVDGDGQGRGRDPLRRRSRRPARRRTRLAAGAALLLVVNDADGELSEWVGADDYMTDVGIPVAAISGVQGRRAARGDRVEDGHDRGRGHRQPRRDLGHRARTATDSIPDDLDYQPKNLARIDTTYHGEAGELVGEFRYDFVPGVEYGVGLPCCAPTRGIERTEWVNTDQVEWYQDATGHRRRLADPRHAPARYEPGEKVETSYFGPIVRPYVGPGYWAPHRSGDVRAGQPAVVGRWRRARAHRRVRRLLRAPPTVRSSPRCTSTASSRSRRRTSRRTVFGPPRRRDRLARREHGDARRHLRSRRRRRPSPSGPSRSTGTSDDYTEQLLPMLQAYYDVDLDDRARSAPAARRARPSSSALELGHIAGAIGSASVTDATLEVRVAGGEWKPVAARRSRRTDADGPVDPSATTSPRVATSSRPTPRRSAVPDAGAWIDLRVTAKDAAGNTFSQEIERAFEVGAAKKGGGHARPAPATTRGDRTR